MAGTHSYYSYIIMQGRLCVGGVGGLVLSPSYVRAGALEINISNSQEVYIAMEKEFTLPPLPPT